MGKTIRRGGREAFHLDYQRKQKLKTKEINRGNRQAIKEFSYQDGAKEIRRNECIY